MKFAATVLSIGAALLTYALGAGATAPQGEYVAPGETAAMQRIVAVFERMARREYTANGKAVRGAHAKGQGCVRAHVAISGNVPAQLRHGVFATPQSYRAWIRFSNGAGEIRADNVPDGRGMAIKLTGVAGPKLVPDEQRTQDFVMINFPVFFIPDVAQYEALANALEHDDLTGFFAARPREAAIAAELARSDTKSVLTNSYFSMTPYRLGSTYVKFGAFPVSCADGSAVRAPKLASEATPAYLRERLSADLAQRPACFDLRLQPRTRPAQMPIEDATILWDPALAPYVTVARVTIPAQHFDSQQQQSFCENLSYSPWHGTRDFRPAGGLNRLRLFVYDAVSRLRHRLNGAALVEPNGNESFP